MTLTFWILFAVFVLLQVADAWTTTVVISNGIGKEANPVVSIPMQLIGRDPALVIEKLFVVGLLAYSAFGSPKTLVTVCALVIGVAAYCYVVWNNWSIIEKSGISLKGILP